MQICYPPVVVSNYASQQQLPNWLLSIINFTSKALVTGSFVWNGFVPGWLLAAFAAHAASNGSWLSPGRGRGGARIPWIGWGWWWRHCAILLRLELRDMLSLRDLSQHRAFLWRRTEPVHFCRIDGVTPQVCEMWGSLRLLFAWIAAAAAAAARVAAAVEVSSWEMQRPLTFVVPFVVGAVVVGAVSNGSPPTPVMEVAVALSQNSASETLPPTNGGGEAQGLGLLDRLGSLVTGSYTYKYKKSVVAWCSSTGNKLPRL